MPTILRVPALFLLVFLLVAGLPLEPADADSSIAGTSVEADFVSRVNHERTSRGLAPLRVSSDLVTVARNHSRRMGDANHLHHNPNFGSEVTSWRKVGENVGRGPSVSSLHTAFMNSPSHRNNLLDPAWTEVGIGVKVVDGRIWVTQLLRLPSRTGG
jgi:uncharacterized protein YkwD